MPQSLLEVARELVDSPEAKSAFADDPQGFLIARGLDELSTAELAEAVGFVADAMPAPVARQLAEAPPPGAPEPAALARMASATVAEESVRESEPGTIDLAAVVDPGGHLDVPQAIDPTTLSPVAADEPDEAEEEVGTSDMSAAPVVDGATAAEAAEAEEADAEEEAGESTADGSAADDEDGTTDGEEAITAPFGGDLLEAELPSASDSGLGDVGTSSGDAGPPPDSVEPPPEDITVDDLM